MRFKIDENLHQEVAALFQASGHDAETVHSEGISGCDDAALLATCQTEGRALVTLDRDFGDVRRFPPVGTAGIVVLKVALQNRSQISRIAAQILPYLDRLPLAGHLWVVTESDVRVRGT